MSVQTFHGETRERARIRRLIVGGVTALIAPAFLAALAVPARAATVTFSGPVTAGSTLTVTCPEGERFVSGSATFYRSPKLSNVLGTRSRDSLVFDADGNAVGAVWNVPKGAKSATASIDCEAIPPPQTVSLDTVLTLEPNTSQVLSCPSGYVLDPATFTVQAPLIGYHGADYIEVSNPTDQTATAAVTATCVLPTPPTQTVRLDTVLTLEPNTTQVLSCPTGYTIDPASFTVQAPLIGFHGADYIEVTNPTDQTASAAVTATCVGV